jgi:hypothetical protein
MYNNCAVFEINSHVLWRDETVGIIVEEAPVGVPPLGAPYCLSVDLAIRQ